MTDTRHAIEDPRWTIVGNYPFHGDLGDPRIAKKYLQHYIQAGRLGNFLTALYLVMEAQKPDSCFERVLKEVLE